MGRLEQRWQRRYKAYGGGPNPEHPEESRTVRFQEACRLRHPPGAVWALIYPAECAPLLSSTTSRGFKVPGTPDGLGEQQCLIDLDGNPSIIEVIHFEADHNPASRII